MTYRKYGHLVILNVVSVAVSGQPINLGTLPVGYRPPAYVVASAYGSTGSGYLDVNSNGDVSIKADGGAFASIAFFVE